MTVTPTEIRQKLARMNPKTSEEAIRTLNVNLLNLYNEKGPIEVRIKVSRPFVEEPMLSEIKEAYAKSGWEVFSESFENKRDEIYIYHLIFREKDFMKKLANFSAQTRNVRR